jgi:hypothetical protein
VAVETHASLKTEGVTGCQTGKTGHSLRLEAGMCLYGHDISTAQTPPAAALGWVVGRDLETHASLKTEGVTGCQTGKTGLAAVGKEKLSDLSLYFGTCRELYLTLPDGSATAHPLLISRTGYTGEDACLKTEGVTGCQTGETGLAAVGKEELSDLSG